MKSEHLTADPKRLSGPRRVYGLTAVLLALAVGGCGSVEAPQASSPERSPRCEGVGKPRPSAVSYWSDDAGVVGFANRSGEGGFVYLTTDGGRSFEKVDSNCRGVVAADTAGKSDAWVTLSAPKDSDRASGTIVHSGDGGETWSPLPKSPVTDVSFATPEDGMATDGRETSRGEPRSARAFVTHDGGETWEAMDYPCTAAGAPEEYYRGIISMASADVAWATCIGPATGAFDDTAFFRTSDGGSTWEAIETPGFPDGHSLSHIEHMSFEPGGRGVITAEEFNYRTADGASTIEQFKIEVPRSRGYSSALDIQQQTADHLLALVGYYHRLVETRDGGAHWKPVEGLRRAAL